MVAEAGLWENVEKSGIIWETFPIFARNQKDLRAMATFIGKATAKLDDKGRLVLPATFKNALSDGEEAKFVVHKDIYSPCLEMLTLSQWQRQSDELKAKLNMLDSQHARFWRRFMLERALVVPDAKVGRITIPAELLSEIGVKKEVVFLGGDYKIEIWSKETFEESLLPEDQYIALAEELSQTR